MTNQRYRNQYSEYATRPFRGDIRQIKPVPRPKYHIQNIRKIEFGDELNDGMDRGPSLVRRNSDPFFRRPRNIRSLNPASKARIPPPPDRLRLENAKPYRTQSLPGDISRRKLPPMPQPVYNPNVRNTPLFRPPPKFVPVRSRNPDFMPQVENPYRPVQYSLEPVNHAGYYFVEPSQQPPDAYILMDNVSRDSNIAATDGSGADIDRKRHLRQNGRKNNRLVEGERYPTRRGLCGSCNSVFLISLWGFLKIVELICSLTILICASLEVSNWAIALWIVFVAVLGILASAGTLLFHLNRGHLKERHWVLYVVYDTVYTK
ncbi:uncharacterized protein LOC126814452 isoform X3 [Patella vulgata]|uniref:uncharacterized protein LOC126814452 isoform X3 n=1 Tax=Patella vulgata TaxID=6465 RepID=UPI00217FF85D|nr:uncharacterized protein LOC126814452 isoform X3 [Patella vulgata]